MLLADKIIRLRKKNGWSQEDLAEKMNISRQAVSKWEGAQSAPDLEKILQLSYLFGVTTDYLLKDEIEIEEFTSNINTGIRRVTMDEANEYIDYRKKASVLIGIGVFLCIISPAALIVLAGAVEYFNADIGFSVLTGIVVLLLLVAAAVGLFSYCGFKNAAFNYLSEEFETEYGVVGMVKERDDKFRPFGIASNIIATCFCILSAVPILIAAFFGNGFTVCVSVAITLFFVATGVLLYVIGTVQSTSMHRILQDGEFKKDSNQKSNAGGTVAAVYWLSATAIYLVWSFCLKAWHTSWILWPVAGVIYPIVSITTDYIIKRKNSR